MLVVNTWPFKDATKTAGYHLSMLSTAINAVVYGCSVCEVEQCDHTVGYGGSPDEKGETTLDAMVMDGDTLNVGAVGDLRNIKNAIQVARAVLEHTNHTLLAGESATNFAVESLGLQKTNLTTEYSSKMWKNWLEADCQPNYWYNVYPDSKKSCGPYSIQKSYSNNLKKSKEHMPKGEQPISHDTIGMIAIDSKGKIATGTTTNGLIHKIPGRVGDSPIMGAGAYADSSVGAAVATGDGDVMMRFLPTFLIVELMRGGVSPQSACDTAIERIRVKYPKFQGAVLAVGKDLSVGAATWGFNPFTYTQYNFTDGLPYTVKIYPKES
ncbi:N4-Beta-N-acetylglucosaminyl-L-asparaginase [Oopsacas minuta]|uniref:N(4)-(beta-N-acetylglucosaminyl)-L-asparaginase n=1 Tax=Oopsacas minuta TaxID=111878 RepID=A0AAV7JE74_9METZ|nr:N4-Beta-N-acetylglucosaminyl-L-asparaginase [Oopsacas minuta]